MKKVLYILALGFLFLGFLGACTPTAESDGSITITVLDIDGGQLGSKEVDFFKGDTLVEVMTRSELGFQFQVFPSGTMVSGFDGVTLGTNDYLKFFINGESASYGVDGYQLEDNDVIMFRITDWTTE